MEQCYKYIAPHIDQFSSYFSFSCCTSSFPLKRYQRLPSVYWVNSLYLWLTCTCSTDVSYFLRIAGSNHRSHTSRKSVRGQSNLSSKFGPKLKRTRPYLSLRLPSGDLFPHLIFFQDLRLEWGCIQQRQQRFIEWTSFFSFLFCLYYNFRSIAPLYSLLALQ